MAKKTTKKLAEKKAPRPRLDKAPVVKPVVEASSAKPVKLRKTTLSKSQLDEFRKLLLDKRRSLIGDMNHMESEALGAGRQEGADLSLMPDHPANIATDNFEQEFTLGLLESERTLLGEINDALERIDNATYGICLGTGEPIGVARLRARPWAKFCIEYARLLEKGRIATSEETPEPQEGAEPPDDEEEEVEEEVPDTNEE